MRTQQVSSGTVFKALIALAEKRSSEKGKKVVPHEVKQAFDSFNWGDFRTTKTEIIAARKELAGLKKLKLLSAADAREVDTFIPKVGDPGGFFYRRSADVFTALVSFFENPESSKGAVLTADEAGSALSMLGDHPAPARVAAVKELLSTLKRTGHSTGAQKALSKWLKAHPIAALGEPLNAKLKPRLKNVLWPSETDRPLYAVDLGKAPSAHQSVAIAARDALGESRAVPLEVRDFDEVFNRLAEVNDPDDPASVASAKKFAALRNALKASLTELHVVRVGRIDIDVYVLGKDAKGRWAGVVSGVVET